MAIGHYHGSCQCGAVDFDVDVDLGHTVVCNCSRCRRLGAVLAFTSKEAFKLNAGEDNLGEYLFNKHAIHHLFCKTCGIESFSFGATPDGKEMVAVNVNCLDGVDARAAVAGLRRSVAVKGRTIGLLKSRNLVASSRRTVAALALFLAAVPASAEDQPIIKCEDAVTQSDMTLCAVQEHEAADKALNEQWPKTKKAVADWDAALDEDQRGGVDALMKAQRAWIQYRDAHCDVEGFSVRGGTLEPAIIELCLAEVTRKRTAELEDLVNGFGN